MGSESLIGARTRSARYAKPAEVPCSGASGAGEQSLPQCGYLPSDLEFRPMAFARDGDRVGCPLAVRSCPWVTMKSW